MEGPIEYFLVPLQRQDESEARLSELKQSRPRLNRKAGCCGGRLGLLCVSGDGAEVEESAGAGGDFSEQSGVRVQGAVVAGDQLLELLLYGSG